MEDNSSKPNIKSLESLYLEKDFEGAKNYILKHRDQFDSGQFHYNLGTLHAKLGDYAVARFHLEKAVKEGYVGTNGVYNRFVVKSILKTNDVGNSPLFWDRFLTQSKELPVGAFLGMTLLLVLIVGVLVRFKLIVKKAIIIPLILLTIVPVGFHYFYLDKIEVAISLKDIQLREGPSKIYSETSTIKAGAKVITGERSGEWIFIKAPLKFAGWAHRDTLGFL